MVAGSAQPGPRHQHCKHHTQPPERTSSTSGGPALSPRQEKHSAWRRPSTCRAAGMGGHAHVIKARACCRVPALLGLPARWHMQARGVPESQRACATAVQLPPPSSSGPHRDALVLVLVHGPARVAAGVPHGQHLLAAGLVAPDERGVGGHRGRRAAGVDAHCGEGERRWLSSITSMCTCSPQPAHVWL